MKTMTKQIGTAFLVAAALVAWSTRTDRDVLVAQAAPKPVVVYRAYTGADGKTHVEQKEYKMTLGADGSEHSERININGFSFLRRPPTHNMDFHPAPQRQFVITLSGKGEVELEDGTKMIVDSDHILLAEDLTGKGHIMRGYGTEPRLSMILPLPPEK
jgi:hypothetical protein